MSTVSGVAAILGMVLGTAGFVMSIMNYLRDRPKIKVILKWDMTDTRTGMNRGLVKVTNVGRRPIFVSIVALRLPAGFPHSDVILMDSVAGNKLTEGDGPLGLLINYDDIAQYSTAWRRIRDCAVDSTGKEYHSNYPHPDEKAPSWVL
jgi:hypothetical protein